MKDNFEHYTLATYLCNLAQHLNPRSGASNKLVGWGFEDGFERLGVFVPEYDAQASKSSPKNSLLAKLGERSWRHEKQPIKLRAWKEFTAEISCAKKRLKTKKKSPLQRNINSLASELSFDFIETKIFGLLVRVACDDAVQTLCDAVFSSKRITVSKLIGALLNIDDTEVEMRLKRSAPLVKNRILKFDSSSYRGEFSGTLSILDQVKSALLPPNSSIDDIKASIFGPTCSANLQWADFDHLSEDRDFISEILTGAVKEKAKGINILLYGAPGTGKTEFCKMVATHLKLSLHSVGEIGEAENEPSKSERISALRLADHLLARHGATALLFDEMEDLLEGGISSFFSSAPNMSKVFINRLLESNKTPTFWTCNDISEFDPALLRRMTYAFEMRSPPKNVRERIWKTVLEENEIDLEDREISLLSRNFSIPPALAENAARSAKLAHGNYKQISLSVTKMTRISGDNASILPQSGSELSFNSELLNADQNLVEISNSLVNISGARAASFCLYGPAGTGKSAYVRHLAQMLGMEVIQKRTSDLISMWVGESEKNIASAFQEAQDRGAFLIFDEADSLLRDRKHADKSWEVTQVNEMLTWMEKHPLPFACTTNLMESLDPASLRRFTFKVNCRFLSAPQTKIAFKYFFDLDAPSGIENLQVLTPGDFSVVRKRAEIIEKLSDVPVLLKMLRQECAVKPRNSTPMGFNAAILD